MDIKEAQRLLLENNGWVQGSYNGVLLSTIGNCSEQGIVAEQREGWKLVAVFSGDQLIPETCARGLPNRAVFERPLPTFYSAPDPWHDGPGWAWLPGLALPEEEGPVIEFPGAGGHGSPFIVRCFRCRCGGTPVRVFHDEERERVIAVCAECGQVSNAFSFEPFTLPGSRSLEDGPWTKIQCACAGDQHALYYGIEYSPDSERGSEFTWISLAARCIRCGSFTEVSSKEIQ